MPRFSLRTLLILLAICPPLLAGMWLYPAPILSACFLVALVAAYFTLNLALAYLFAWIISSWMWLIGKMQDRK